MRFIFITGGVCSSLGKGVAAASLGAILQARGLKVTMLKMDPYLNVDPGTMNPSQHGEIFVTQDGGETDLDLGHYERFLRIPLGKRNNITSGQIYSAVLQKERRGEYSGQSIQLVPHMTNEIKDRILALGKDVDIVLVEVGGTVGDIDSILFLEAIRQIGRELGSENTVFAHLVFVPFLHRAGEFKTKPAQQSIQALITAGLQPDIIICRSEQAVPEAQLAKIALHASIERKALFSDIDMPSIYQAPLEFHHQGLDDLIIQKFKLAVTGPDLSSWEALSFAIRAPKENIKIALVGKYADIPDAYKSLMEALNHAGIRASLQVQSDFISAEDIEAKGTSILKAYDAILVPGGFGVRGIEGKIAAAQYAREHAVPYLGICLGMQIALIEMARHLTNQTDANSTEFNPSTHYPIIKLIEDGSMRLGAYRCSLQADTVAHTLYGKTEIIERHRHRYEVNIPLVTELEKAGLVVSGRSQDGRFIEMIELSNHPWFLACQFHPELTSNPIDGHTLFSGFARAALAYRKERKDGFDHTAISYHREPKTGTLTIDGDPSQLDAIEKWLSSQTTARLPFPKTVAFFKEAPPIKESESTITAEPVLRGTNQKTYGST